MNIFEVLAHEGEELIEQVKPQLDEAIRANSIKFSLIALGIILLLTILAIFWRQKKESIKYFLFGSIVLLSLATTIYLAGSTIYLNQASQTGGPIHWHADFEIWHCGQIVDIKDPTGFSNKVGTEVVHEHNDNRMHFEGVLLDLHDASVGHFFEALGGSMNNKQITVPTDFGMTTFKDGDRCSDGTYASMQVFVYKTHDKTFTQKRLEDPQNYVISPYGQVPPGDCIIIEFDKPKEKTDKLCNFYKVAVQKGELHER